MGESRENGIVDFSNDGRKNPVTGILEQASSNPLRGQSSGTTPTPQQADIPPAS